MNWASKLNKFSTSLGIFSNECDNINKTVIFLAGFNFKTLLGLFLIPRKMCRLKLHICTIHFFTCSTQHPVSTAYCCATRYWLVSEMLHTIQHFCFYIMPWHLRVRINHLYTLQSLLFSHSKHLNVCSISALSRWSTVVHHHQEHDGGRGAGGVCGGLWLASAGGEPHVSERGHVPSQAAGQHPAPAAAGRNGFHPAHCHRQQWVSTSRHEHTYTELDRDVLLFRHAQSHTLALVLLLSPSQTHTHTPVQSLHSVTCLTRSVVSAGRRLTQMSLCTGDKSHRPSSFGFT